VFGSCEKLMACKRALACFPTGGDIDWAAVVARGRRKSAQAPLAIEDIDAEGVMEGSCLADIVGVQALLEEAADPSSEEDDAELPEAVAQASGSSARGHGTVLAAEGQEAIAQASGSGASSSGLSAADRLRACRRSCMTDCRGASTEDLCHRLCFTKSEIPWQFVHRGDPSNSWDTDGVPIGRLQVTFAGATLQGMCLNPAHTPRCKLLLQCKGDMPQAEARILRWLAFGVVAATREEHMRARDVIRAEHTAKSK